VMGFHCPGSRFWLVSSTPSQGQGCTDGSLHTY